MKGLLHIGMPTARASAIRDMFLADESNNFYLGKGPTSHVPSQVQYVLETEILNIPSYHYNEKVVSTVFNLGFEAAEEQGADTFIVSDENAVTPMGDGYESHLQRFKAVMPEDTVALFVIREQLSFLKSFYKHRVTMEGMTSSFEDFVKYQIIKGSKGLFGLLDYTTLILKARDYFPHVEVVLFEDIKANTNLLHERLTDHGITLEEDLPAANVGMTDCEAGHALNLLKDMQFNLQKPFEFAVGPDELTTMTNNTPQFNSLLIREKIRIQAIGQVILGAKTLAENDPSVSLDYSLSPQTESLLKPFLAQVNTKLAELGLPIQDAGYHLG